MPPTVTPSTSPTAPSIIPRAEALLAGAVRAIHVLGALSPVNAARERERLLAAWSCGKEEAPRWEYPKVSQLQWVRPLEDMARELDIEAEGALPRLYAARARELALEARLSSAAESSELAALASARFGAGHRGGHEAASELARRWVEMTPAPREPSGANVWIASGHDGAITTSDGLGPESLRNRLAAEVGRLKLPFRVVVEPRLTTLAATGDATIFVAAGRTLTHEDVARTVLHEVHGHALPRARSRGRTPRIYELGTAGGTDDQEGLALWLEDSGGFLTPMRRRELALRHGAVLAMLAGGSFVEIVRGLVSSSEVPLLRALSIAERAFRGSSGASPGLGRERVYLGAFLRVRERLESCPSDERVLGSGQISVDSIDPLAALTGSAAPPSTVP